VRYHRRGPLPAKALAALQQWQSALDAEWAAESAKPLAVRRTAGTVATSHWNSHRQTATLDVVELALSEMASPPAARCMYCEHDLGSEIDHIEPKSRAPVRTFQWENLLWACGRCNRQKLERYDPNMLDPTRADPLRHLDLLPNGRWHPEPTDPGGRGQATLAALSLLNEQRLVRSRVHGRGQILREFAALAALPSVTAAALAVLREKVTQDPFPDVFAALLDVMQLPGAADFYPPQVVDFVRSHPEMSDWLAESDERRWLDAQGAIEALASTIRRSS